jgi:hypothetical protein
MNATYAIVTPDNYSTIDRGALIEVRTVKGDVTEGTFVSFNTKGINVKTESGRVVSRSLGVVAQVALIVITPDTPADMFVDGETYGAAAIAAALDMSAYDLRVILRDLGMGVGKGRRYGFDAGDARTVYRAVKAGQASDS